MPASPPEDEAFLNSVQGEITFFRSIMRARPVGRHRFFHVLAIRSAIYKDSSHWIHVDAIWNKLRSCYNLDALEAADLEHENVTYSSKNPVAVQIPIPSPSDQLADHPFFRSEFQIPYDDDVGAILTQRRMRATPSTPSVSSPLAASPTPVASSSTRQKGSKKRGKSQSKLAGLIGGDSDSSALTQESGDEALPETPRESVVTGTDAGTEYGEDEETEMREPSPQSVSPKPARGRSTKSKRGRGTGTRGSASTRSAKKRKR